jgi:hypothetical protein
MNKSINPGTRTVSNRLHGLVYVAMIGFASLLTLSAWGFAGDGYENLLLAVVTGLVIVAVGLPCTLWRVGRKKREAGAASGKRQSFRDWAEGEFDTWQGRLKARTAAIEVLLPLAAVAFGMMAFAIVLHFVVPGAA